MEEDISLAYNVLGAGTAARDGWGACCGACTEGAGPGVSDMPGAEAARAAAAAPAAAAASEGLGAPPAWGAGASPEPASRLRPMHLLPGHSKRRVLWPCSSSIYSEPVCRPLAGAPKLLRSTDMTRGVSALPELLDSVER